MASSDDDGEVIHPAAGAARGWARRRSNPSQTEAAWQSVSIVQSQIREGQGAAQGAPAVCQAAADAALLADIALRHSLPGPCVRDIVEYIQRPGFSAARAAALSLNKQVLVAALARQQASNQAAFAGMHAARVQLPQRHMNQLGLSEPFEFEFNDIGDCARQLLDRCPPGNLHMRGARQYARPGPGDAAAVLCLDPLCQHATCTRVYAEPHTCDLYLSMERLLKSKVTAQHTNWRLGGCIFASDKAVTNSVGQVSYYPLYMSLVNLPLDMRRSPEGWVLVAMLPVMKAATSHCDKRHDADHMLANNQLLHQCWKAIVQHMSGPLFADGATGCKCLQYDAGGSRVQVLLAIHSFIVDYPEICLLGGVIRCPLCHVTHADMGCLFGAAGALPWERRSFSAALHLQAQAEGDVADGSRSKSKCRRDLNADGYTPVVSGFGLAPLMDADRLGLLGRIPPEDLHQISKGLCEEIKVKLPRLMACQVDPDTGRRITHTAFGALMVMLDARLAALQPVAFWGKHLRRFPSGAFCFKKFTAQVLRPGAAISRPAAAACCGCSLCGHRGRCVCMRCRACVLLRSMLLTHAVFACPHCAAGLRGAHPAAALLHWGGQQHHPRQSEPK